MVRRLVVGSTVVAALCAPLGAQVIRVRPGEHVAVPGFVVELPIEIETNEALVTGFSFGVRHDASKLRLQSVTASAELLEAMGLEPGADPRGDFFLIDLEPEGDDGFVVAAILSVMDAGVGLRAGVHPIFAARYEALGSASGMAEVAVTGDLGSPPVPLVIDADGGTARTFAGSAVNIGFAPAFRRGDTNGDGRYNLSDAIRILFYLFQGGAIGDCPVSLNVDGSTRAAGGDPLGEDLNDIQITDAIQLLQFLFADGIPPVSPFQSCGQSAFTLSPEMVCREFPACP